MTAQEGEKPKSTARNRCATGADLKIGHYGVGVEAQEGGASAAPTKTGDTPGFCVSCGADAAGVVGVRAALDASAAKG
jgi:hypothetical protein